MNMNNAESGGRLVSLDVLRGFDLFLLLFFQPVLIAFGSVVDWPWLDSVLYNFEHEDWIGFRLWDLVMPLFLFMVGTSMPFSFARFDRKFDRIRLWKKVIRRFVILFVAGMIVQGNLLAFDPGCLHIYANTLQAIACGYLIAAAILLNCTVRWQLVYTLALLLAYWMPMTFCGDFTREGSFAFWVDEMILGRFHGDPDYTWIWSSLTFGVTVMLGAFAGQIIRNGDSDRVRTAVILAVIGCILVGLGLLWGLQMPVIKKLWTCSMTLLAGGYCFMLMALFYFWIDCKGHVRGLGWLKIYGMNAITAYMIGEVIDFRSIVKSVSFGLEPFLGDFYQVWLTFGNFLILFLILRYMYRERIFLKI